MSNRMGSNPADLRGPGPADQQQLGAYDPEPLNLRQREVLALEAIAKTLEAVLMTRESAVKELLERLEADIERGEDYRIGEALVRKLFEAFRENRVWPEK